MSKTNFSINDLVFQPSEKRSWFILTTLSKISVFILQKHYKEKVQQECVVTYLNCQVFSDWLLSYDS